MCLLDFSLCSLDLKVFFKEYLVNQIENIKVHFDVLRDIFLNDNHRAM